MLLKKDKNVMKTQEKIFSLLIAILSLALFFTCTKIEFDNPYDSNSIHQGRPVIVLLGPELYHVVLNDDYIDPGYVAKDDKDDIQKKVKLTAKNEDGDKIKVEDIPKEKGMYTVFYNVEDNDKKKAETKTREIEVLKKSQIKDSIPPVITIKGGDVEISLGEKYEEKAWDDFSAIDNPGNEDVTDKIVREVYDENGLEKSIDEFYKYEGKFTIHYNVTDAQDNRAKEKTRKVTVGPDIVKPVLELHGDNPQSLLIGDSYKEGGASAIDNVDGDISRDIIIDASEVDTTDEGNYTVYYSVSDKAGNEATKEREVKVLADKEPPVITLKGKNPMTIESMTPYKEEGARAIDNVDGDLTQKIKISGEVDTTKPDDYEIKYEVTDNAGNTGVKIRLVKVQDTKGPVIKINPPNPVWLNVGFPYSEKGATAYDSTDGDVTVDIDTIGEVNINVPDVYEIHYRVKDKAGNESDSTRIVNVINGRDVIIPFIFERE